MSTKSEKEAAAKRKTLNLAKEAKEKQKKDAKKTAEMKKLMTNNTATGGGGGPTKMLGGVKRFVEEKGKGLSGYPIINYVAN